MQAFAVTPSVDVHFVLPGTDYADAFALDVPDSSLDARRAAERAFQNMPSWVTVLLGLRNVLVRPLGLRPAADPESGTPGRIGFFPLVSDSPRQVVMGFDDAHLDFRVVVEVIDRGADLKRVVATTLIKRNNALGSAYLRAVLPFHRAIVPAMLSRIATPA